MDPLDTFYTMEIAKKRLPFFGKPLPPQRLNCNFSLKTSYDNLKFFRIFSTHQVFSVTGGEMGIHCHWQWGFHSFHGYSSTECLAGHWLFPGLLFKGIPLISPHQWSSDHKQ